MQLYIAYTKISNGMVDDKKYSAGQVGDVNMPSNGCGVIMTLDLNSSSTAAGAGRVVTDGASVSVMPHYGGGRENVNLD